MSGLFTGSGAAGSVPSCGSPVTCLLFGEANRMKEPPSNKKGMKWRKD